MIPIPSPLVEFILLGPLEDRRQLQDSPILGDVWVEYGKNPANPLDLLIAPYRGHPAGLVATKIDSDLDQETNHNAEIAFLQGLIVARLAFEELIRVVVPKTVWWTSRWDGDKHEFHRYDEASLNAVLKKILEAAEKWHLKIPSPETQELPAIDRFVALAGLLLWAGEHTPAKKTKVPVSAADQVTYILKQAKPKTIAPLLLNAGAGMLQDETRNPLVWQISRNREPLPALTRSVAAVKADAAHTLFKISCNEIGWAVIDSGIDGAHPAFREKLSGKSRIKAAYDFRNFRKIVSLSNWKKAVRQANIKELRADETWKELVHPPENPDADLEKLAVDARNRGPIHWELVERFVQISPEFVPPTNHGTHVAGIIGANRDAALAHANNKESWDFADGMCPDIGLYDFRVLGKDIKDAEFAIIAALQFIRYLNARNNLLTIHGANLSLSIPHDVRNFACGRTPICNECEHMIESGVVVVAAAGNHGYKSFETKEGTYDSYAAFSITDPGNADGVITVGATHRFWPHTYGVSFFSSRGPTGDGRLKPDLVAPGEKIRAPFSRGNAAEEMPLGGFWGDLDGTSMAAPHVSGAAAMLMGRYSELIGQPRRIKRILCENATDLGRERSFQGHGMLDVLRAFQSI